jgi:transposase
MSIEREITEEELTAALRRETSHKLRKRLKALRLILKGNSSKTICCRVGIQRAQLFQWVHLCEANGLAGLLDLNHGGGRSPGIQKEILDELKTGLAQDRWKKDQEILAWLREQHVSISASGLRYWRRKFGFKRKQGRPPSIQKDTNPKHGMLHVQMNEPQLQRIEARLKHSMTKPREKALQSILLLAARCLYRSANSKEARYLRMLHLATRAKDRRSPGVGPADIAKEYEQAGWSIKYIVSKVRCSRASCYNWVKRFKQEGIDAFL